ncbi:methyltransferase [Caulobacter sp. Root1472]|uniref:methyltransferase n=1 Tax=Caulobacter sp. Root1472 TaxID=1736470 RepID=UPI000A4244E4|nr:methyltransferase [Caulobacter sp. Root1472]
MPQDLNALTDLLHALSARNYAFVSPNRSTARRMFERLDERPADLRDIFGWNRPFEIAALDPELLAILRRIDGLVQDDLGWRCTVRVSTVHGGLFVHSAFPAEGVDAVFLGPDTYRFADLIARERPTGGLRTILDVGTGAGAGGLIAARQSPAARVILSDVNPRALRLARANAAFAGIPVETPLASGLDAAPPAVDLIVCNPPYIAGASGRAYKDGGDLHGARLSLDWATAGMERLSPGGRLILYTGSAILRGGVDVLHERLETAVEARGCSMRYAELDPDVFGSELCRPAYADAERIAAVGAVIDRPSCAI